MGLEKINEVKNERFSILEKATKFVRSINAIPFSDDTQGNPRLITDNDFFGQHFFVIKDVYRLYSSVAERWSRTESSQPKAESSIFSEGDNCFRKWRL